ncbi:MAG: ATP-binding protein [Patescibacteria group bacterium]
MMESVDKRWYVGYTWWITISAIAILAVRVIGLFVPFVGDHLDAWGITGSTVVLALVTLAYRFTLYKRHSETLGLNFATLLLSMIQLTNVINLINVTDWSHSLYIAVLYTMFFFSGIVGIYPIIGGVLLLSLYILISIPHVNSANGISVEAVGILAVGYLMCVISYFMWRHRYIDQESQKVSHLAGLLKNNQQQSEILIQSIADGVVVINTEGEISLINPAASAMTEWAVDEANDMEAVKVIHLTHEDGKELEADTNPFINVIKQQKQISETMQLVGRKDKKTIVSVIMSPILLPKTNEFVGAVAVLRDVSEARKAEQQRADFISTASHEMRTPVAAIEGYLALALNEKVSKIDPGARGYLEKAHSSTQHLGALFQDLLTSAKAEDGRLTSNPSVVELGSYVEQITDGLRLVAEKKGLAMDFLSEAGSTVNATNARVVRPLYYVYADPDRLREVITNLFDNAVKYTEKGRITIGITGDTNVAQFFIKDTGLGIPVEDLAHLFQKFYRVDNSATRTIGGTGLGLFICRKIIELYNGRIWVESQVGKGSSFYINLPRLSNDKATALLASDANSVNAKPVSSSVTP